MSRPTIARYLQALEEIFLVKRIPGWSRNLGTRATAAPKLIFVDSGIAANEIAIDARTLLRPGAPFEPLRESFVLSEMARQLTSSEQPAPERRHRGEHAFAADVRKRVFVSLGSGSPIAMPCVMPADDTKMWRSSLPWRAAVNQYHPETVSAPQPRTVPIRTDMATWFVTAEDHR